MVYLKLKLPFFAYTIPGVAQRVYSMVHQQFNFGFYFQWRFRDEVSLLLPETKKVPVCKKRH